MKKRTDTRPRRIPLFDLRISTAARKEVADTLKSGWLSTGPKVNRFEQSVSEYLGLKHAVAVSSCTAGLQILLAALGAVRGKEIITSPFTFVATIEAILLCGGTPVLADIDPQTLNIDPNEVNRKITKNTAVVLPIDIAGSPAPYGDLRKLCNQAELPLISDSAHAITAKYRGKSIPSFTDGTVYSFYSTKNLTCGEGGMVVSRHRELIEVVRSLSRHGLTSNAYDRKASSGTGYDVNHLGFKANMSDLHASIGLGQIGSLDANQEKRRHRAERYIRNLEHLADFVELPVEHKGTTHGWHLFIIKLNLPALRTDRDQVIALMAKRGIECGVHYRPIFELSYYRKFFDFNSGQYPHSESTCQRVISLPLFPELKLSDIDYVCDSLESIVKKHRR